MKVKAIKHVCDSKKKKEHTEVCITEKKKVEHGTETL